MKLSTRLECISGVILKITSHTALRLAEFLLSNAKRLDGTLVAFSIFERRSSSSGGGRGASLEPTQQSSCEGRAHSAAKQTIHSYAGGVKASVKAREPPISLPCMHACSFRGRGGEARAPGGSPHRQAGRTCGRHAESGQRNRGNGGHPADEHSSAFSFTKYRAGSLGCRDRPFQRR